MRRRLLLGTVAGVVVVLLAAGVALYCMMRTVLLREYDAALLDKAATLAAMIEQEGGRIEVEFTEAEMSEFERADRPQYFQVWHADGTRLARSSTLGEGDLPASTHDLQAPSIENLQLPDGRPGRLVLLPLAARLEYPSSAGPRPLPLVLGLARDTLDLDETLGSFRLVLVGVGLCGTLAIACVLAWLVPAGLRPASRLAERIAGIVPDQLAIRLDPAQAPGELRPIVQRLNELLADLHQAFIREKTFTADAAHELRTPLAGLRSTLEVALTRDREPVAYRQVLTDCLSICHHTQSLVEQLLALARLDAGSEQMRLQQVSLDRLITQAWEPFDSEAQRRQLRVTWHMDAGLHCLADGDQLRLLLCNLFDNAVRYANAGGRITVEAGRENAAPCIRITNTGSGVAPGDAVRVFDRFWRGDMARGGGGPHCGLGLALCRRIVERLGGTIAVETCLGGDFAVTVRLAATT